jgi:LuxR family transcriptional regulator, maltose regulon positive regulatory protein
MTDVSGAAAVPDLPVVFLSRSRLLALLERAGPGRVVIVRAPAGFGKTALLADWARRHEGTAWLRQEAGPLRAQLAAALAEQRGPTRLVIDDVDELGESDRCVVADLLRRCPPGVRCAVAGERAATPGSSAPTVEAPQLAFTSTEAAALLAACRVPLDAEQVRRLHRRTGGWATALQLAAICLRRGEDPEHLLRVLGDLGNTPSGYGEEQADLAVVRMLPSPRSLAQIADHLQVSVPVARGRVHAAYIALGASSRRGAVLAAQERGLLR